MSQSRAVLCGLAALLLAGCLSQNEGPAGPPEGWTGDALHWWRLGVDTVGVFRDLETLDAMTDSGVTYAADFVLAHDQQLAGEMIARATKESLIRIFRNEPEVVDSLFRAFVIPKIQKEKISGDPRDLVRQFKKDGYKIIRRHFREPRTTRILGKEIQVAYPDSLRRPELAGSVDMQVHLDTTGSPDAIELLSGLHPVLDEIALRATTEMRWQPAYLLDIGKSDPIPSWARFSVTFTPPESP